MAAKVIQARFFASDNGRRPVRDWLMKLSGEDRKMVGEDIKYVEFMWPVGMPHVRPLGEGLYEVRGILTNGNQYRVFFCLLDGALALLHAIEKKTQKTPPRSIALAKERKRQMEEGYEPKRRKASKS